MSDEAPPASTPSRSHFNNWISAIGGVVAIGALFSFLLLAWMDFTQGDKNPYLGIFTYIVAPTFLIGGLGLVFLGRWMQRRWAIKHAATQPDKWRLDFRNPKQRARLILFGCAVVGFLILSAFGSYQSYHIAESTDFCGAVCHEAMHPEFATYKRGAHARVDCVECHVGSGAQWFIKAKINGTHQLIAYTLDNYKRPIETPLKNLRPAQDTCEKCHWPEKFHGNVELSLSHTLSNKKNTRYDLRMLMRVNVTNPGGHAGGIHWHVNKDTKVEYFASDEKRQEIPWMRVTDLRTGEANVYRTAEYTTEPRPDQIRVMDCMDCHNRPAHTFPTANDVVEKAIAEEKLSTRLPAIKRVAVQALLQKEITRAPEAPTRIADFLRSKYTDQALGSDVEQAIATLQEIYPNTIFPERKADWRVYPNNIGHKDWPGCFRCHDDKHVNLKGTKVRGSDCNSCHTILAQGTGGALKTLSAEGLEFAHPDGDYDADLTCSDCHNGGIQK